MSEETKQEFTPEQIAEMQEKMEQHYDSKLPMLRKQCEYEELIARIETARFQRMDSMHRQAMLSNPQNKEPRMDQQTGEVNVKS